MLFIYKDAKAGMKVRLDDGFTCIEAGIVTLEESEHGLFFRCSEGIHLLDGQLGDTKGTFGKVLGVYPVIE